MRLILILLFILTLITQLAQAKEVVLEWKKIKNAVKYEIQIERDGKVVVQKTLDNTKWKGNLGFGVYGYQIRAIDKISRPGKWSTLLPLAVLPEAPKLATPNDGDGLKYFYPSASTTLKWKSVQGASRYKVTVLRDGQTVHQAELKGTELTLPALQAGKYSWQVAAVVEPSGRSLASLKKSWLSKPSDEFDFKIERETLKPPSIVSPVGVQFPPQDRKLQLQWKEVEGAVGYEVTLKAIKLKTRGLASDGQTWSYKAQRNSLTISSPGEGTYTWSVRAIASTVPAYAAEAKGPESRAEFELDRNAVFVAGTGYVAFSTMLAPYTYEISDGSELNGRLSSASVTMRLSGEYWISRQWGIGAGVDSTFFTVNNRDYTRSSLELVAKYRLLFNDSPHGWSFSPKLGIERRGYVFIYPGNNGNSQELESSNATVMGPTIGFDLRKTFSDSFSIGMKIGYFYPIIFSGDNDATNAKLTSGANARNISIGLQGLYWLSKRWGLGAGGFLENRSLSVLPQGSRNTVRVSMDGTYFFGSVIFTFGR